MSMASLLSRLLWWWDQAESPVHGALRSNVASSRPFGMKMYMGQHNPTELLHTSLLMYSTAYPTMRISATCGRR